MVYRLVLAIAISVDNVGVMRSMFCFKHISDVFSMVS